MKRVLVTGADGFIGSHLVEALIAIFHSFSKFLQRKDAFCEFLPCLLCATPTLLEGYLLSLHNGFLHSLGLLTSKCKLSHS